MSLSNRSKAIVDVFVYENVDGANVSIFLKRERERERERQTDAKKSSQKNVSLEEWGRGCANKLKSINESKNKRQSQCT